MPAAVPARKRKWRPATRSVADSVACGYSVAALGSTNRYPQWAQRVARQASGLLEPLAVHEIDPTRGEARLRSQSPTRKGDEVQYYEAVLNNAGQASLHRYRASHDPHRPREMVPFTVTHEAAGKLVDDLIGT
jgi:hypothetical protein